MARKRLVLAVTAGVAAFAAVAASAATLGGLNSTHLGADMTVVASCDTDGVNVSYVTAYDAASASYKVTGVSLANVAAACNGEAVKVTLGDSTPVSLSEVTGTISGTSQTLTLAAPVSAKAVTSASVVISG